MTIIIIDTNNDACEVAWRSPLRRRNAMLDKDHVKEDIKCLYQRNSESTLLTTFEDHSDEDDINNNIHQEASSTAPLLQESSTEITPTTELSCIDSLVTTDSNNTPTNNNNTAECNGDDIQRKEALPLQSGRDEVTKLDYKAAEEYLDNAIALFQSNSLSEALEFLEKGLQLVPCKDVKLYLSLQQWHAQVLGQLRRYEECLQVYRQLIQTFDKKVPDDVIANWCFAAARLSIRLREYQNALDYYQDELIYTPMNTPASLLAVSRICHDSAKVAHLALGDLSMALKYYQEAFRAEQEYMYNPEINHQERVRMRQQLLETQRCMGRIHFQMGHVDQAIALSMR